MSIRWSVVVALSLVACTGGGSSPDGARTSSVTQALRMVPPNAVLTQHNDVSRTGQQIAETVLNPTTLGNNFGLQYVFALDGRVFAQPLYVPGVATPAGTRNVVYVVTENNSLYAFDADSWNGGQPIWKKTFNQPLPTGTYTPVPSTDVLPSTCMTIPGTIGITGTPVIDYQSDKIYFVAATKSGSAYQQNVYAVDIKDGTQLDQWTVSASVSGAGLAHPVNLTFNPETANQRAALTLAAGKLWITWASHCLNARIDYTYAGWVMGLDPGNLASASSRFVFNAAPNDDVSHGGQTSYPIHGGAGIWMGGGGPVSDGTSIWVGTGNGWADVSAHTVWGDSVLRIGPDANGLLGVRDHFTPYNYDSLYINDLDISSSGLVLLPSADFSVPGHAQLLAAANKSGVAYVLDAGSLGGDQTGTNHICSPTVTTSCVIVSTPTQVIGGPNVEQQQQNYGVPAYWRKALYYAGVGDNLKQFSLTSAAAWPASATVDTANGTYGYPAATPSISAKNATDADALVWTIDRIGMLGAQDGTSHLFANRADNLQSVWASTYEAEDPTYSTQFQTPTIAGGHVFVGAAAGGPATSGGRLYVYGQFLEAPATAETTVNAPVTVSLYTPIRDLGGVARGVGWGASYPNGITLTGPSGPLGADDAPAQYQITAAQPGTYTITWYLYINSRAYQTTTTVTVDATPPHAEFTTTCTGWTCTFDASQSTGGSGPIVQYNWNINGYIFNGSSVQTRSFAGDQTISATLLVWNSLGYTSSVTHSTAISDPVPEVAWSSTCHGRRCHFDASATVDPPAAPSWQWYFGDQGDVVGATTITADHTYAAPGTYTVTAVATDPNDGNGPQGDLAKTLTVTDTPPVASFTAIAGLAGNVRCNPAASSDDDGITSYAWDFGDGTTTAVTSPTIQIHSYLPGTYTIALTVTDTFGQTNQTTRTVTVSRIGHVGLDGGTIDPPLDAAEL